MTVRSTLGALAGGVAGALLWALMILLTGLYVVFFAIIPGVLVGLGSAKLGGKGQENAIACGGIALVAIFAARFLAIWLIAPHALQAGAIDLSTVSSAGGISFEEVTDINRAIWSWADTISLGLGIVAAYVTGNNALALQEEAGVIPSSEPGSAAR